LKLVMAGPANRLFTITGQFDIYLQAYAQQPTQTQTYTCSLPGTAEATIHPYDCNSLAVKDGLQLEHTSVTTTWSLETDDADWDDEQQRVAL
jgi:hypothetical protein